jgi:hypothetical protein
MKKNAAIKYRCFTCLRLLGVKNSEIAKRHGIHPRVASFAVVDFVPRRVSKAEKYTCGLCLRRVGLGACRVNKILSFATKCEWSAIFKRSGLQNLPMIKPIPYKRRTADFTEDEKQLYRDSFELDAQFPDWSLDMIVRYEMTKTGLSYQGTKYQLCNHHGRNKGAQAARKRHERIKRTPEYRIKTALKNTITRMKRNGMMKNKRSNRYLGCTYAEAMRHIEKQFKKGMTWANHGSVWHIDHIVPLASFDLCNDDHVMMCCHYTNLQPMWARENIRKSDTVPACQPQLALAY